MTQQETQMITALIAIAIYLAAGQGVVTLLNKLYYLQGVDAMTKKEKWIIRLTYPISLIAIMVFKDTK